MIKATAARHDGGKLLLIGLSDHNAAKLKQDCPIMAPFTDFGIDRSGSLIIAFLHPDGKFAMPEDASQTDVKILLNEPSLEQGATMSVMGPDDLLFAIIRGKTEADMQKMLQRFITPQTKVKHYGVAPSDIPPSMN